MLTPTALSGRSRHLDNNSNKEKGTDTHTEEAAAKGGHSQELSLTFTEDLWMKKQKRVVYHKNQIN